MDDYKAARKHIESVDPIFGKAIRGINLTELETGENFLELCSTILSQQLSTKVARVIYGRFCELFPTGIPTSNFLLALTPVQLRAIGISFAKASYLLDLAARVEDGRLDLNNLNEMEDQQVIDQLVEVKGIGVWSAQMFLIFHLGRPDVFAPLDLGLRKGIQLIYSLPEVPTVKAAESYSQKWAPYRSFASRYLWRVLDAV